MAELLSLNNKHVVVTGAYGGIGRELCFEISKLGASISMLGRDETKLYQLSNEIRGDNYCYTCDLLNIESIGSITDEIVNNNGPIDGFVHCAGIAANRPLRMMKPDYVDNMMRIHYYSFIELIRNFASKGKSNPNASFVGVSSVAAARGDKSQGAYSAAKAAMDAVIHPIAKELSSKKIRVNTIAFGMVDTEMYNKDFLDLGCDNNELLKNQYLGIINPVKAAEAICFLLSDASMYMTGTTLNYDAGVLS